MEKRAYKTKVKFVERTYAGKRCIKQRVWDFMRRNKIFKVSDLISILDIKETTLKPIICSFEAAGYCKRKSADKSNKRKKLLEATFVFLARDNILIAPIINSKKVKEELC